MKLNTGKTTVEKSQRAILLQCLKYARHRLSAHQNTGIHRTGLKINEIDKTIQQIRGRENKNHPKPFTSSWVACTDPLYYLDCPNCNVPIFLSTPNFIERLKRWARKKIR